MLGKGSNTLVSDGICSDAMISTKALSKVRIEGDFAVCECGASVRKVVEEGRKRCLGGLEFLSGVPCSVGGALKMNAGAFGAQIGDYVYKMRVLNLDCDKKGKIEVKEINADDLHFSYRRGAIGIVLEAVLRLGKKKRGKVYKRSERVFVEKARKTACVAVFGKHVQKRENSERKTYRRLRTEGRKKGRRENKRKAREFHRKRGRCERKRLSVSRRTLQKEGLRNDGREDGGRVCRS